MMKFHGGNQILQKHSSWFTIFEWWIGRRCIHVNFYKQHVFHFLCRSNHTIKGKDNCLDLQLHILGLFFGYTDYGYGRYKNKPGEIA